MMVMELLQVAIGRRKALSKIPSDEEWQRMFASAGNHAIIGLLYGGIEKLPKEQLPNKALLINWFGHSAYQKQYKRQYDAVMLELVNLLNKENVHYIVFKGAAVAAKYPEPALRTMGDIDFYVPPGDFDRAVEVIEQNLCRIDEKDYIDKHFAFSWKNIRFEMHYQMETFGCQTHQQYFAAMVDDAIKHDSDSFEIEGMAVPMLPKELDIIHVFKHWMGHLLGEGIGLRQTTDLAVLIKAYKETIDIEKLKKHLVHIGYLKAFDAVVKLVELYYLIVWPEYWKVHPSKEGLSQERATRYAGLLIEDVMRNGNFGRSDYKYKVGWVKRMETTMRFFEHCRRYHQLAPEEIAYMIPKRIAISLKSH